MQLIFCDESCHLAHDNCNNMILGAIWTSENSKERIYNSIKDIKKKYGLDVNFEIKWTKVSYSKIAFYEELVDFFFNEQELGFRVVIASKQNLKFYEDKENDDYATWYYKMYFLLLNSLIYRNETYRIFIDIKDTLGGARVRKLQNVLCNNIYDFKKEVIKDIIQVHSHSSQILQITDLLIGAMSYNARNLTTNRGKVQLIDKIKNKLTELNIDINKNTPKAEQKYNIFYWEGTAR